MAPQNPFKNMPASKPKQPVVAAQPPVILAKQPSSIAPAKVTMTAMPKMPQAKAKPATPEVVVATPAPVVVQETSWDAALTAKREENAEKALRVRRDAVAARASTPYVAPKEGEEEPWRVAAREQNERNEAISLQMRKADEEKRAREAAAAARVATAYVAPEVESEETEEAIIAPAAWNADDGYTVVPDENDEDREPFTIQTTPREQHYARPVAVTSPRRPFPGSQPVVEKKLKTFTVVLTPDLMLPSKSYLENVPRDDVPWRSVELEFIYDDDRRMRVVKEGFRAITENEARMLPFFNEDERKVRSWQCRLLGIEDARDLYGKDKEWSTGPTCHLLALPTRVLKLHATTGRPLSETETQPSSGLMSSRVGVLPAAEGRPPDAENQAAIAAGDREGHMTIVDDNKRIERIQAIGILRYGLDWMAKMAAAAGLSRTTMSSIVSGRRRLTEDTFQKIVAGIDKDLEVAEVNIAKAKAIRAKLK